MTQEKMIMMANQIAQFFSAQPGDDQAQRVANHINDFWEPRMRMQLLEYLAAGGSELEPLVVTAQKLIKVPEEEPTE